MNAPRAKVGKQRLSVLLTPRSLKTSLRMEDVLRLEQDSIYLTPPKWINIGPDGRRSTAHGTRTSSPSIPGK